MKKKITLIATLTTLLLTACNPRVEGDHHDYTTFNKMQREYHVVFAKNETGAFSDGSYEAEREMGLYLEECK